LFSGNFVKHSAILQTALVLFADHGFHDAPMAKLAESANVGVGTIYRYFNNKNNLIQVLYKSVEEALHQAIIEEVDPSFSTELQFKHLITNLVHYLYAHPTVFKFLEQYYHSPFGLEKKREKLFLDDTSTSNNAFGAIFSKHPANSIKALPISALHALAFGPVLFLLRDAIGGLIEMSESLVQMVTEGCWDAIKKDDTNDSDTG